MAEPADVREALAKALHWWRCFCGQWPCTEAIDGAYFEDADAVIAWLHEDGCHVVSTARLTERLANALARPDVRTALLRAEPLAGATILANALAREVTPGAVGGTDG